MDSHRDLSVLSPSLFNVYINDLPATQSRKFIYADDICLGTQHQSFDEVENVLNTDMDMMADFLTRWRLQPSATKTVSSVFHLHNAQAKRELNISKISGSDTIQTRRILVSPWTDH